MEVDSFVPGNGLLMMRPLSATRDPPDTPKGWGAFRYFFQRSQNSLTLFDVTRTKKNGEFRKRRSLCLFGFSRFSVWFCLVSLVVIFCKKHMKIKE